MTDKRAYLAALDIPLWLPRANHPGATHDPSLIQEGVGVDLPPVKKGDSEELSASGNEAQISSNPLSLKEGTEYLQERNRENVDPLETPLASDGALHPDDWSPPLDDNWEPVFDRDVDDDIPDAPPVISREARIARLNWEELTAEACQCTACELCGTRTQVVFGVGDRQAEWLVIGEAPGADEDRQGEPFVGRAGKLLNPMLLAIGLKREQVYIANILKCRPPDNREPTPTEAVKCRPFLQRQIDLIRPRIILAVGRVAAQNLLETDTQIGKLRGRIHHFGATRTPVVVTYHPAYLLRSPREKRKAWDDLRLARRVLAAAPPDSAQGGANS